MYSLGIDFGASTIDIVLMHENQVMQANSSPVVHFKKPNISKLLKKYSFKKVKTIYVTGWGARFFPNNWEKVPVKKVNEITAIALGVQWASKKKNCLAVSLGSGTALVSIKNKKFTHLGGTAIGGRTVLGLGQLLLKENDIHNVLDLAQKGNLSNVDLTLKKIYPKGLGALPLDATASHFGDIQETKKTDIAAGIINLLSQSVGSLALFAARSQKHKTIVFTGKLSHAKLVRKILKKRIQVFEPKFDFIFPKDAAIATAVGATLLK